MGGYQNYGYYPDPEEERRQREMDLTQDPEALAGIAGVRPPTMDLTQDPEALQGSPDWQKFNQSRADMRGELDDPPPTMDMTRDPEALNSPLLRQQAAARPQPPAAAGMPSQGSLASLLPQRDPQMDSRWRTAENTALDRSGYMGNQPYGAGEAVRDFAPMAIGGTLDVLLNKGRGLKSGAIIGAGMQANALQEKNRQGQAKNAGSFALQARDQRSSNSRANVAAQTEGRQQQIFDLQNNPDNPQAQAFREQIYARSPSMQGKLDGLTYNQMRQMAGANQMVMKSDFTPQLAQDAGQIAQARKAGTYRADDEHYPTRLDQEAGVAAATADARNQVDVNYLPQRTAAEVDKQRALIPGKVEEKVAYEDAGVGAGQGYAGHMSVEDLQASNPGLKFTNPKLVQDALKTRALTKDVVGQIQAANRGSGVIDEMYKSAAEAQDAMKRGDVEAAYAARKQYQSHVEEYAGILGKVTGSSSAEQQRRAMDLAPSVLNPMALEGIKALWPSIAVNVKGNLGSYGIEARTPSVLGGDKDAPPSAAPAPPRSTMQGGREVLPRGNAPPLPADVYRAGNGARQAAGKAPMSGGSVNQVPMAKPNGDGSFDIDGETYTADEVQKLKLKGLIR
jgi:hypothetical protein